MKTTIMCMILGLTAAVFAVPRGGRSHQGGRPGGEAREHGRHGGRGGDRMSSQDQRLINAIEEADDLADLRRLSPRVLQSRNPDVRIAMIEALEDQGPDVASELAIYLADPDENVADAAFSAWTSVLEDVPARRRLGRIIRSVQCLQGAGQGGMAPGMVAPVMVQPGVQPAVVPQPVVVPQSAAPQSAVPQVVVPVQAQ